MPLPQQVTQGNQRADDLIKQISGNTEPAPEKPEDKDKQPEPERVDDPVKTEPEDVGKLKHKLSVLEGKYNAEVKKVRSDNERLQRQLENSNRIFQQYENQIKNLNDLVTELQGKVEGKPDKKDETGAKASDFIPDKILSEEDLETLDEEGLSVPVLKILGKLFASAGVQSPNTDEIKRMRDDINSIKKQTIKSAEEKFWEALDSDPELKNWRKINESNEFNDWLDEVSPVDPDGRTRRDLLTRAYKILNVRVCANMFKDYMRESGISEKPEPKKDTPDPKSKLEGQLEPDASGNIPPKGNDGKKRWTRLEIKQFYQDVANGKYRHREAEQRKIEQDITLASAEGRILNQ